MACEERIIRVLRTLQYPGVEDLDRQGVEPLGNRTEQLARIVSWVEDRKVRGLAIADREPLRSPGPEWEGAFYAYLKEIECPYAVASGRGGGGDPKAAVLRGVSWLVSKAVSCEFEDNGQEYNASATRIVEQSLAGGCETTFEKGAGERGVHGYRRSDSWPSEFLSALDAACRAVDVSVEIPLVRPPPPPSGAEGAQGTDVSKRDNGRVLKALEALLSEVQRRVSNEDRMEEDDRPEAASRTDDLLEDFAAGASTGDDTCDRVATVLRMLYLLRLRGLQDNVNALLAAAQASKST